MQRVILVVVMGEGSVRCCSCWGYGREQRRLNGAKGTRRGPMCKTDPGTSARALVAHIHVVRPRLVASGMASKYMAFAGPHFWG
jgi:hypothetical protein